MILAVMITVTIGFLNPFTQIQKSQNAQRQQNLKQVQSALDSYYDDANNGKANCYPQPAQMPLSNATFKSDSGSVYLQKMPADPVALSGWKNYAYVTDAGTCPQWNVLFAKIAIPTSAPGQHVVTAANCPLMSECPNLPANFLQSSGYNYCVLSGDVSCDVIEQLDQNSQIVALGVSSSSGGNSSGVPSGSGVTPTLPPGCDCSYEQVGDTCKRQTPGTGHFCTWGGSGNNTCMIPCNQ
jgi:type II secretory pathway pseudopilin PulG